MVNERRWLALIFILYFLLGVGYSLLMPIWEAPDEPAHYHLAWRLARKGEYATEELNYEANQPRTFYILGSYMIRALDKVDTKYSDYVMPLEYKFNIRVAERRFDWNDDNYRFLLGLYTLRWINLLFGALALWINWMTFRWIAPDKPTLGLSALALAGLTPQYLHIMSSVNNDALGTLAGALLFYFPIRVIKGQSKLFAIAAIILAIALPLATKLTVLPMSAALLAIVAGKWYFGLRQKRWLVIAGLVLVFSVGILYFFFPEAIEWTQKEITWRLFSLRKRGVGFEYIKTITSQIVWTYWGKVGWIAVGLAWWVVDLLTAFGFIGIALQAQKIISSLRGGAGRVVPSDSEERIETKPTKRRRGAVATQSPIRVANTQSWMTTLLIASFTVLAVARNGLTTGATQGRFLFPAIGALSLLMVGGWHDVSSKRVQQKFPLIVVALMFALNIGLWVFGIIPVYYQPFLD